MQLGAHRDKHPRTFMLECGILGTSPAKTCRTKENFERRTISATRNSPRLAGLGVGKPRGWDPRHPARLLMAHRISCASLLCNFCVTL